MYSAILNISISVLEPFQCDHKSVKFSHVSNFYKPIGVSEDLYFLPIITDAVINLV